MYKYIIYNLYISFMYKNMMMTNDMKERQFTMRFEKEKSSNTVCTHTDTDKQEMHWFNTHVFCYSSTYFQ